MPINGIKQPETIDIDNDLRLRKFYASFDFALPWYEDVDTVYLVDGVKNKYNMEHLAQMYRYLDSVGELYFIEYKVDGGFRPIGDVTFSEKDIPIVIGEKACRGKGIGKKVLLALIERAKMLGYSELHVTDIYSYNIGLQMCFKSVGFRESGRTEKGSSYTLTL